MLKFLSEFIAGGIMGYFTNVLLSYGQFEYEVGFKRTDLADKEVSAPHTKTNVRKCKNCSQSFRVIFHGPEKIYNCDLDQDENLSSALSIELTKMARKKSRYICDNCEILECTDSELDSQIDLEEASKSIQRREHASRVITSEPLEDLNNLDS